MANFNFVRFFVFLLGIGGLLCLEESFAQSSQAHPSLDIQDIRPNNFEPLVSGMDFLSNGDLVLSTWEDFAWTSGKVFILENPGTAGSSVKEFANGLDNVLGLTVVDDEIYILERTQLSKLVDSDNNGTADQKVKISGGWSFNPNPGKNLDFALGLLERDGIFYGGLATAWPLTDPQGPERGCMITMEEGQDYECIAGGVRTPNGLSFGPEGELFVTDNQGNYVPGSRLNHVKDGRFFGVKKNNQAGPFDNTPMSPPVVWMPHRDISVSPSQPLWLTKGVYAGQFLIGDQVFGGIQRAYVERVNGEYQGGIIRFSGGIDAGPNRMIEGPDGDIYVGGIGVPADVWSGWWWNGTTSSLQKIHETEELTFDILAVKSVQEGFIIEFTDSLSSSQLGGNNVSVSNFEYNPGPDYGCCKGSDMPVNPSSVQKGENGKSLLININNLNENSVYSFELSNIQSKKGASLWQSKTWYTLNQVGPADVEGCMDSNYVEYNPEAVYDMGFACVEEKEVGIKPGFSGKNSFVRANFQFSNEDREINIPFAYLNQSGFYLVDVKGNKLQVLKNTSNMFQVKGNVQAGLYFIISADAANLSPGKILIK